MSTISLSLSYISINKINPLSINLSGKKLSELYTNYYNIYKDQYTNGQDFCFKESDSKEMKDLNEEVDELICDYEKHLKKRGDILSKSIFEDMLDELGKNKNKYKLFSEVEIYKSSDLNHLNHLNEFNNEILNQELNPRASRKFSDTQKQDRKLEIRTEEELDDQIKNQKNTIDDERLNSFNMNVTEDYNLSISQMDRSVQRGSEILLSQPNILTNSQISRNPYSMTNMLSAAGIEEVNISRINSNMDGLEKKKSINESIDMAFFNQLEAGHFNKFVPLDLPDIDLFHNSVKTRDLKEDEKLFGESNNLNTDVQKSSEVPSDLSDYSPKFLSDLNVS
jgi:hypothetical protein